MVKTCATYFIHVLVHRQAVVECDAEKLDVICRWNNRARNVDRGDIRERVRTLPSSEENRIGLVMIRDRELKTAPGVQGSETFFKAIDLTGKVGWRKRNIKL